MEECKLPVVPWEITKALPVLQLHMWLSVCGFRKERGFFRTATFTGFCLAFTSALTWKFLCWPVPDTVAFRQTTAH